MLAGSLTSRARSLWFSICPVLRAARRQRTEGDEIRDLREIAKIALEIGLFVAKKPEVGAFRLTGDDGRHPPAQDLTLRYRRGGRRAPGDLSLEEFRDKGFP